MKAVVTLNNSGRITSIKIDGERVPLGGHRIIDVVVSPPTQCEPSVEAIAGGHIFSDRFERDHFLRVGDLYVDELTVVDHETTIRYTRTDETILIDVLVVGPPTVKARLDEGDLETGIICTDDEQRDAARRIGLIGEDDS